MSEGTHIGFVVVSVLKAGQTDAFGKIITVEQLNHYANNSAGLMWVIGDDLLTHQPLENSRFRLDD